MAPEPDSVPPVLAVVVQEHSLSPDMVEVTALHPEYPEPLLREQIERLGAYLGSPPRGLAIQIVPMGTAIQSRFLKASFATDGIIDRAGGVLNLEPVVKAFLGAPEPFTVEAMIVTFAGERPNEHTLQTYRSGAVSLKAAFSDAPVGIEYRILAFTQDPEQVKIPARHGLQTPAQQPENESGSGSITGLIATIAIVTVAGSALVYFALLRASRRP